MKYLSILGSTGSIGTQTLDVVRESKDELEVLAISGNNNVELLKNQILEFSPQICAVMDDINAIRLRNLLPKRCKTEILTGMEGLIAVTTFEKSDIVVTAISGMIGLKPTMEAIKLGKTIALANKETLVAGGEFIMSMAKEHNSTILPVDSEHSAILQALRNGKKSEVNRLILTASGGPFREKTEKELENVTIEQALAHPNWVMGKKITIDSATLMNKGLEVIEAKYLFDIPTKKIDVIVHPESVVHSAVEFVDHSIIAQLGDPNMRVPIQYALFYPDRKPNKLKPLDIVGLGKITFEKPNTKKFRCLALAYDALKAGGTMTAVMNAANEVAVDLFLNGRTKFTDIPKIIEQVMLKHPVGKVKSLDDILDAELWARIEIENKRGVLAAYIDNM